MARYVIDKKTAYYGILSKHDVEDSGKSSKMQLCISAIISQLFKANTIRWQNVF